MGPSQLAIYAIAGFVMAILSGIAGSGAGFVLTPLAILLGLSPAQAVSSGKFNGVAVTIGSLIGLRKYQGHVSKKRVLAIMLLAFVIGLFIPFIIKAFDNRWYQLAMGIILLILLPVMYFEHLGTTERHPSRLQQLFGGFLLSISLVLQGIFSGGVGTLVNIVLMGMLGQTTTEAQITKRWSQLILNVTIIFGLLSSGLIIWSAVVAGTSGSLVGGIIGGQMAVRKGDRFATNILMALMAASAIILIVPVL